MKVVFAVALLFGAFYALWWGYKNLLGRERESGGGATEGQLCQICRKPYPLSELVIREKAAGFENYFCGDCIKDLVEDYRNKVLGLSDQGPIG